MFDDDRDFHYATDTEIDRQAAYELGAASPERAWILTDRDVWHANPYYTGPAVRHPEDDIEDDGPTPTARWLDGLGAYEERFDADEEIPW